MSEDSEKRTIAPHMVLIAIIIIVILAVIFWPSGEDEPTPVDEQPAQEQPMAPPLEDEDTFEPEPAPAPVEIDPDKEIEPMDPQVEQAEPEPLDSSDEGIRQSLSSLSPQDNVNTLLVDEGLLQRFVVSVSNVANDEMANEQPLKAPEQTFRVYSQAGKEWIDAASYKRYTPYVQMMESMENTALLEMYKQYKPQIQEKYAEIGDPDQPFDEVVSDAIDQLLNTPEVPVPVEVYSDSVAYKYADPQLENLSEPQKQLLRTGPDNMRRIKAKLRELKALMQENGSE
ncbi:DUF3014 domain-containing protein [Salinimonas sediminis]|uniref:DUF3014 domain-containing protein n=1 Tax=Salinimonas sediminis TaxID=2303538 RepID=A0A346NHC5_9ALTE|nr:DUF3014 domain-containing protein [Salinimonas sediminis]AXR04932.1 DUF3014 domain-containing protein [Salinimonas sediminis]